MLFYRARYIMDHHAELLYGDPDIIIAHQVRQWRHALQKRMLGRQPPKPEDMPEVDRILSEIEDFEGMTAGYLTGSKIAIVFRHAIRLPLAIPREAEFHILERMQLLMGEWLSLAAGEITPPAQDELARIARSIGQVQAYRVW
ncbi:hypothetical protein FA95DRAFT_1078033 [Auriscalpium vulgare]|uniref:Uncharacterized protein n=1 Tax=Auriscalpium vulgare TaxID=40419 RepID=A0ACB8R5A9_9AGAM|nr:hypothetical protein FA95DRAFT_1078033 [Auriscalpium vulgare]